MGDVVFCVFQCLNPSCTNILTVKDSDIVDDFEISCPVCGYSHKSGETMKFFDYKMLNTKSDDIIETGTFEILVDDYINEAQKFKYCIICNALKPLDAFDKHSARLSGRQGECRLCKTVYNNIKNQTRITDQHREASQKRRLYIDITGGSKIDSDAIRTRFDHKCFKCGCDLSNPKEGHLDHTLPVSMLWPLTTNNATLLCGKHNSEKSGKWPSAYYNGNELKRLAVSTGIPYDLLTSSPHINPDALEALKDRTFVENMLAKYAPYIDELIKVRNRILRMANFDFFAVSPSISKDIIRRANARLKSDPKE